MSNTKQVCSVVDITKVPLEETTLIDKNIDSLIERYKGSRQEVNRLVFESVAAMTVGNEYEYELSSKRGIRRFIGSITGSNKELQDKINQNKSLAQYASQQTLMKLAEQNLMSFDLIATVNNKLNASMVSVKAEFVQVYDYLGRFFKKTRSDLIQLETRVERLEKNVNLLNWQNSIEYQMFNGVEYSELDDTSKLVCLARDFYEITKGNWTTSDLLLLKTAMNTIDISPKKSINYFDFIKQIGDSFVLKLRLLDGQQLIKTPDAGYLTMMSGIKKLEMLQGQEAYIVDTVLKQVGTEVSRELITANLAKSYLTQETQMNVSCSVPAYELILELIYNIRQAMDEGLFSDQLQDEFCDVQSQDQSTKNWDNIFQKASELFRTYHPQEALPLLKELSDAGYSKANALLYWLYRDGYYENKKLIRDYTLADDYLKKGMQAGDCICCILYSNYIEDDDDLSMWHHYIDQVEDLASDGDVYAEYTLGLDDVFEEEYSSAMEYFINSNRQGFYRAAYSIFLRYYNGDDPFEQDWRVATAWGEELIKCGFHKGIFDVAYMYMNIDDYECSDEDIITKYYEQAMSLWTYLFNQGSSSAATNLGFMYEHGKGTDCNKKAAMKYYEIAADHGDSIGQKNLTSFLSMSKFRGDQQNMEV